MCRIRFPPNDGEDLAYSIQKMNNISASHAMLWSQSPAPPNTISVNRIPSEFVGKNSIVWNGTTPLQIFKVEAINGMEVTTNVELHVEGDCHFTLDAITPHTFNGLFRNSKPRYYVLM